ncbi:MAG TPA: DUF6279 family lipoprotein [Rhizobacter sp.]|nr:DUF6279 family lipoprotein [Rhizobacter sp.]
MLATLFSGCGAVRIAYNQAPTLSYWWLDAYADFNDAQTPLLRDALAAWFGWHRDTQLPDYAQFLAKAQARLQSTEAVSAAEACRWYDEAWGRIDPMLEHSLPMAVPFVQSLTPPQVQHIQSKYDKVNREFTDKYLQKDPQDRLEASVDRAVKQAEDFYGPLDDAQRELLAKGVALSPFDPDLWLSERKLRQQEALQTLRRLSAPPAPADETLAALRVLVGHVMRSPRDNYRAYQQRLHDYNCALGAQLHNGIGARQRLHAMQKLQGWEEDARSLAAEGAR